MEKKDSAILSEPKEQAKVESFSHECDNNEEKNRPSEKLLADIEAFIREHYEPESDTYDRLRKGKDNEDDIPASRIVFDKEEPILSDLQEPQPQEWRDLHEVVSHVGETFQQMLFRLIKSSGMSEVEIYQKAQIDRKVFSKIRRNPDYIPRKGTVLALAIALQLNLDETKDLLSRAGQALSPGSKRDLIVEYCIRNRIYNLFEVNEILYEYHEPVLP